MLTIKQKKTIELCRHLGNIDIDQVQKIYASYSYAKEALKHLVLDGYLSCNYGTYVLTEKGKKELSGDLQQQLTKDILMVRINELESRVWKLENARPNKTPTQ